MKISTGRKLGQSLVSRGNEVRSLKAMQNRFGMKVKEIQDSKVKYTNAMPDKLGMLMAVQSLGDKIAETIANGMNMCDIDFSLYFKDEQGNIVRDTLGENAVEVALLYSGLYWSCWDREIGCVNMSKAAEIVEQRRGAKMLPIYEPEDINKTSNKFNMNRLVYGMNDYYLRRTKLALESVNADTTLEELELFQRQFVHPTRGMGEQTIDISKHVDNVLCCVMADLVSPYAATIGRVRKFESNIKTYRKDKVKYEITIPSVAGNGVIRKMGFMGHLKLTAAETFEENMNNYIEILDKETSLDGYKKYADLDLSDPKLFEIALMIDSVEDALDNMTDEDRERALSAIYNRARVLGVQDKVFDVAMKLATCEIRRIKGKVYFFNVIGTDKEYKADIYRACMLFNDIFVAKYNDVEEIEVPIDYELSIDLPEGEEFEIIDGYGLAGHFHSLSSFQNGTIRVKDGEIVALYNPEKEIINANPEAIILPVAEYAKDNCKFGADWTKASAEDLTADEEGKIMSVGYNAVRNSKVLRIVCPGNSNQYCVLAVDKNGNMTASAKLGEFKDEEKDFVVQHSVAFKSMILCDRMDVKIK